MTYPLSQEQILPEQINAESSTDAVNSELNNVISFYQKTPDIEKDYSCGIFPIGDGIHLPSAEINKSTDLSNDEFQKEIVDEMMDWELYMYCKENEERKQISSRTNVDTPIRNQDCSNIVIQSLMQNYCNNLLNNSYNGIGEAHYGFKEDWDVEIDEEKRKKREQLALEHRSVGNKYYEEKEYPKAIEHYTKSLSLLPTTESFNNRAMSYLKLKNFSAAIRDTNEVLKMEPTNVKALYRRAMAKKEMRMFQEALDDIRHAMTLKRKVFSNVWNDIKNEMAKLNGKKYNICPQYGSQREFEVDVSQLMVYANSDEPYLLEVDKIGCTRSCVCGYCTEENRRNRSKSSALRIKEKERWKVLTTALLNEMNIVPTNISTDDESSKILSRDGPCNTYRLTSHKMLGKSNDSEVVQSKNKKNEINESAITAQLVENVGSI